MKRISGLSSFICYWAGYRIFKKYDFCFELQEQSICQVNNTKLTYKCNYMLKGTVLQPVLVGTASS